MTSPSSSHLQPTPDAVPNSWVDHAPAVTKPYLRLMRADRPIGTWLLLIPCWWGLAIAAAAGHENFHLLDEAALFAFGAFVMRGAGCAYNDIVDRDFDAQVARTALRPIPSGQISLAQAWAFLAALSVTGLFVLLQFNFLTIVIGLSSLVLVAAYPFMKRITYWPQAWLGLTFNWGALVGYAAIAETLSAAAVMIYAAGIFWTLGYDTIYAHQDTEDDALIGVKSTALKFGATTKKWLTAFYLLTIMCFAIAGILSGLGPIYFLALTPTALHFMWQIKKLDIHNSHNCLNVFRSNREAGLLLLMAPVCELTVHLI